MSRLKAVKRDQVRAERRTGELLRAASENEERQSKGGKGTGRPGAKTSREAATSLPTLHDLKITRDQSSDWQKLAAIPEINYEPVPLAVSKARALAWTLHRLADEDNVGANPLFDDVVNHGPADARGWLVDTISEALQSTLGTIEREYRTVRESGKAVA